jgi:hypothetical protein
MLRSICRKLFSKLVTRNRRSRSPLRPAPRRLIVESLERRKLLAASPLVGISDSSFEAPALAAAAYQIAPGSTQWQYTGIAGVSSNGSGFTAGNPNAPDGNQVAFIKNNGSISQQVYLDAGVYNLVFLAAQRTNYQTQNQELEMLVDGAEVGVTIPSNINLNGTVNYAYTTYRSLNFPVTTGLHTVVLQGMSPATSDSTIFLDQVATVPVYDGLIDGGFEQLSLAPNGYATDPSGTVWQFSGTAGISRNGSDFATNWVVAQNAPQGYQTGYVQGTGSISQTVYLDAGSYELSLLAAQRAIYQTSYQEIQVQVDGIVAGTINPVNTLFNLYQTQFTVGSGGHTIQLVGLNPLGGDNTVLLDALSLSTTSELANGSFETPALAAGAFQVGPADTVWQFSPGAGVSSNGSTFTSGNPNAPDGSQVAFLKDGGSMMQSAYLYAGVYDISFLAAQRGNYQTQSQQVKVLIDGAQVGLITPVNTNYNTYKTVNFSVTAGVHTVEFLGVSPATSDSTALIDLAQIAPVSNTITDGGFETPILTAGTYQVAAAGASWQFSGLAGISSNGSPFTFANPNASAGVQVAFLKNDGSMSQTVHLDAGCYNISFLAAQRASYQAQFQQIAVLVDGSQVGFATPSSSYYNPFQTTNFYVAAGTHTIRFVGANSVGGDNTAFVDQVAIALAADTNGDGSFGSSPPSSTAVSDGGFEVPMQATNAFQIAPDGSPWQFSGMAGVSGNASGFTIANPNAPAGSQVGFIKNSGSISQAVYLDSGQYNASFLAAQRANYQTQPQQIKVLFDGAVVDTITPADVPVTAANTVAIAATSYSPYQTPNFQVATGMHTIQFLGLAPSTADSTAFIDDVLVTSADGINDGSFEQAALPAATYSFAPTGTPWQFSGSAGVATNASAFTIGNTNAPTGVQVAFIKGTGSMSQSVYLNAGVYGLSFMAAQRATSQSQYQELQVLVDGVEVGRAIPSSTAWSSTQPVYGLYQTRSFTVTTGFHTVKFLGLNPMGGDNTALVDEVQI